VANAGKSQQSLESLTNICLGSLAKPGTAFWVCRGLKKKKKVRSFQFARRFTNVFHLFDPAFTCKVRAYGVYQIKSTAVIYYCWLQLTLFDMINLAIIH